MILKFEVIGKAQGLDRSRQTANGHRFDSAKNRNNKAYIRMKAEAEAEKLGMALPLEPGKEGYMVILEVNVAPPKSYTKKKLAEIARGEWRPLGKPDLDNVLKLYLDALNGSVIEDDRYVTEVMLSRKYNQVEKVICYVSRRSDEERRKE